jgi:hypothetical protein
MAICAQLDVDNNSWRRHSSHIWHMRLFSRANSSRKSLALACTLLAPNPVTKPLCFSCLLCVALTSPPFFLILSGLTHCVASPCRFALLCMDVVCFAASALSSQFLCLFLPIGHSRALSSYLLVLALKRLACTILGDLNLATCLTFKEWNV